MSLLCFHVNSYNKLALCYVVPRSRELSPEFSCEFSPEFSREVTPEYSCVVTKPLATLLFLNVLQTHVNNDFHMFIGQAVVRHLALPAVSHQVLGPQGAELVGNRRGAHV